MNKKLLTALCICTALLVVMVIFLIVAESGSDQPETGTTEPMASGTAATEIGAPEESLHTEPTQTTEETPEETDPSEETKDNKGPGEEPDDRNDSVKPTEGNKNDSTKPTEGNKNPGQTEPTKEPTSPTIPPEDVGMGTEEDKEATGNLDDNSGNTPTSPTQGKEEDQEQTTPPTENEGSGTDNILGDDFDITTLTYEEFMAMTGEQQRAVIDLFGSPEDFMIWFKAVEAIYKAEHPDIEIGGDGNPDFGG